MEARAESEMILLNGDEEENQDWYWQWVVHSTAIRISWMSNRAHDLNLRNKPSIKWVLQS